MALWTVTLVIAIIGIAGCFLRLATARARDRKILPPPVRVKLPLHWCLILFLLIELGFAFVLYSSSSHGFSVDGRFWLLLVVNTAAIVVIFFRLVTQRTSTVDQLPQMEFRRGFSLLIGIAGGLIGACGSSFLITGQLFYPPTTSPAVARDIFGFTALSGVACVVAATILFKRREVGISE